ncbi:nuclear transport factor 2 family protein [Kribbella sp. CA-253562]|uniref:nuclear transport factor 2 family protein n=1 Tax=Kribbella sp. CA-253562 TaxID=3239942 RepID=UPI003D920EF5
MTAAEDVLDRFCQAEAEYVAGGGRGRGDFGPVAAVLHPEVCLWTQPGLPYGGVWRGREGIENFLAEFSATWSELDILSTSKVADGEQVAVHLQVRFTARITGRALETSIVQLNRARDGLVTEFRTYYWDPAAIAAVTGRQAAGDG